MHIFHKAMYLFIILASSLITTPIHTHSNWYKSIKKYPFEYGIIAVATTCIIGRLLYDYYHTNLSSNQNIVDDATELYEQVKTNINDYYSLYGLDNQLSDNKLKERIALNSNRKYPFLHYYKSIIKRIKQFNIYSASVAYEIKRITLRKDKLLQNDISYLLGTLVSLEEQGTQLLIQINKIQQLALSLKNRIGKFEEYKNDMDNWSEEKKDQWNHKDDSIWHNETTTMSQETHLVCGDSAAELIKEFNLNYY